MKYVISWNERPQGSPVEYETAQKRGLAYPWGRPCLAVFETRASAQVRCLPFTPPSLAPSSVRHCSR